MRRRIALILAGAFALVGLGVAAAPLASADVTHIHTLDTGLVRLCVVVESANSGVCLHV